LLALKDRDFVYQAVNPAFCNFLGRSEESIIGKTDFDLFPRFEAEIYRRDDLKVIKTGKPQVQDEEVTGKAEKRWLRVAKTPVLSEKGAIIGVLWSVVDITNRKLAEGSLARTEQEKKSILDSLLEHVVYMDLEMRILWANTAACKSINLTRDELIGRHCFELWADSSEPCSDCAVVRAVKTGQAQEIEKTTPDGRSWFNIGCPVRDEKNTIIGGIEVVLEITERKHTEIALKKSEERFRNLTEITSDWIWEVDKNGFYTYVSPKIQDILGYDPEGIIGKTPFDLMPPAEANRVSKIFNSIVASRKTFDCLENLNLHKNGHPVVLETSGIPIFDVDGAFRGYRGIDRDITERKQVEVALRESEGKLNAMLQSIGDHISMMDKDLNIVWANRITKTVFGNDIIGKKCYEVYHRRKEPCEPYPCITLKAFQDGKAHEHDTQAIDQEGKKIFFHCTANVALRDKEGKPTAVLEICRDITEHKQAELALIERGKELENKTHELEEVNAALRVLLKHREEDKKDLEDKVVANVKELVFPYVEKLNNSRLNDRQMVYLNIIKSNLEDIITPFLHQLSSKYSDLTPNEIQVAGFVKEGKTTKEIAELLNSSTGAINFHRNNLRKKLGLRNTKTNLRSFLLSLA
jgi:PAS domain S-box-containing protein